MPAYRIVSELDPGPAVREPRGARLRLDETRVHTVVTADSLVEAVVEARNIEPHDGRRITHVEEVHPGLVHSDESVIRALTDPRADLAGEPLVRPDTYGTGAEPLYESVSFADIVAAVAYALRESGLVPGMDLSVLHNETDEPYAMVEIHDDDRGAYLSHGVEIRDLTDDRAATGEDGLLAVARALIAVSNDLH